MQDNSGKGCRVHLNHNTFHTYSSYGTFSVSHGLSCMIPLGISLSGVALFTLSLPSLLHVWLHWRLVLSELQAAHPLVDVFLVSVAVSAAWFTFKVINCFGTGVHVDTADCFTPGSLADCGLVLLTMPLFLTFWALPGCDGDPMRPWALWILLLCELYDECTFRGCWGGGGVGSNKRWVVLKWLSWLFICFVITWFLPDGGLWNTTETLKGKGKKQCLK